MDIPQHLRMRILAIEDEPDLLRGLIRSFRDEGYAVDSAADGEEGLFKALAVNYDVIVLDAMLPRLDGWEVLRRLRMDRKRKRPCYCSPHATKRPRPRAGPRYRRG